MRKNSGVRLTSQEQAKIFEKYLSFKYFSNFLPTHHQTLNPLIDSIFYCRYKLIETLQCVHSLHS